MFNFNFSLTDFAYSVPTCQPETEISSLLAIFLDTKHHYIAIVDRNERLVGIVSDRSLYARIIKEAEGKRQEARATVQTSNSTLYLREYKDDLESNFCPSKSAIELPIESPIILSSQMSASESIAFFKVPDRDNKSNPIYALVDADEKFVGILNTEKLIKFLLFDRQNILESKCQSIIESWQKWSIEILERIPLPFSLQTKEGKTIYENPCWREQIDKANNLNISEVKEKKYNNCQHIIRDENEPSCLSDRVSCQSQFVKQQRSLQNIASEKETKFGDNYIVTKSNPQVPTLLEENLYSHNNSVNSYEASSENDLARTTNEQNSLSYFKEAKACLENAVNYQQSAFNRTMVENEQNARQHWQKIKIPIQQIFVDSNCEEISTTERHTSIEEEQIYLNSIVPFSLIKDRLSTSNNPYWLVLATKNTPQKSESELAIENADLLAINRFKDELIATLSHELKSPLTAILGLSSLLKEQKLGQLNQRQNRYMELINNSARQLMSLINDLLDLARLETGQLQLLPEPLQIKTVCENAYQKTVEILRKKKQGLDCLRHGEVSTVQATQSQFDPRPKFTLTIEPGLEIVSADKLRLQQMLVNLLDNAHKFTEADGEIGLVVERWRNYVAFTVWDNGFGIPEEAQNSILRRYSLVEDYKKNSFNEKGLGLVFTQRLAIAHGGDISFISKVGRGSEFTLLLPCSDRDTENLTSESSTDKSNKSKTHPGLNSREELVLVVEELACNFEKLIFNLKGLGYHIIIARTEVEALEKARQLQPDKIVLNLVDLSSFSSVASLRNYLELEERKNLPLSPAPSPPIPDSRSEAILSLNHPIMRQRPFSGWDVLTLLKSDLVLKEIPAIAIAPELAKEKAKKNGANKFLSLPIDKNELTKIFPPLSRDNYSDRTSLQILRLYPEADAIKSVEGINNHKFELIFRNYLSSSHHRIIEADSLEQADLLTRIWNLDVVVLDGSNLKDPLEYLRSLREYHALASLPLVILDAKTTKIANQFSNLSVFPCLIFDREQNLAKVLEVIEIAAKAK
jgi:signal transduction histidine kinase/CheY-like chemotaxis protein